MSDIPIRSVQFPVVLAVAALLGAGIGTWLGRLEAGAPHASPSSVPSLVASATPALSVIRSPTVAQSPSASPTLANRPSQAVLLQMGGESDATGEVFEVRPGWQIVWQTDGERFAFAVRGDQDLGTIVDQTGPSSGVTSVAPAGTFQIEVTAKGPWSIKVVQGQG
jgi:hypothetical protein